MLMIGCDFHAGFAVLAIFDNRTGVQTEKRLAHPQEAVAFYRELQRQGERVRVGMEAGPPCQWFRRLLSECGHELWVGDAARIRAAAVGKKKTDREDAKLILQLLREGRFPRIWVPTEEERDVRQLLLDRHHRVRARTAAKNQLQALAMNQGVQKGRWLWTESGRELLAGLTMSEHTARRRDYLLRRVAELDQQIAAMDVLVAAEVERRPAALRLKTHPGVGAQTALATVLTLGEVSRFHSARAVSAYLGLVPGGEPLSLGASGERLSGAGAGGVQLGRQAAVGTHQQARVESDAVFAGGSRAVGGEARCRAEAGLQTFVGTQGQ